jgi:hypothetical protein
MRIGTSSGQVKSLQLSSVAKNSVAPIKKNSTTRTAKTFMHFLAPELSATPTRR